MDWLQAQHEIQRQKIGLLNPKRGSFVQLGTWFGDVWAEIETVYGDSISYYSHRKNIHNKITDHAYFYQVRDVRKTLPHSFHILTTKEGRFGGREGKLYSEIPKRIEAKIDK